MKTAYHRPCHVDAVTSPSARPQRKIAGRGIMNTPLDDTMDQGCYDIGMELDFGEEMDAVDQPARRGRPCAHKRLKQVLDRPPREILAFFGITLPDQVPDDVWYVEKTDSSL